MRIIDKMSLVAIPLKNTGDVDLVKPITNLISSSRSIGADDKASLAELQALRVKMVSTIKNKTFTDACLRDMENYFDQLGSEKHSVFIIFLHQLMKSRETII